MDFMLIVGQLYKLGPHEILCRCVLEHDRTWIMSEAHGGVTRGLHAGKEILCKILQTRLWWLLPPKLYLAVFYQVSQVNWIGLTCLDFKNTFGSTSGKCLLYYITCSYPMGEL